MARLSDIIRSRDESYLTLNLLESENNLSDVANSAVSLGNLGVTATAAELNTLDGITANTTELNYVDGVTSAIQTQLNTKASLTGTETLSNKILKDYSIDGVDLGTVSGNTTIDSSNGNFFTATANGNVTFEFANAPASGDFGGFVLQLTSGGDHTITWPATVDWPAATAPELTANSGVDIITFVTSDGGTIWTGLVSALDVR